MEIVMRIPAMGWLVISALLAAIGDYYSKRWALHPTYGLGVAVVLLYTLCSVAWLPALFQRNELARMVVMWLTLSMIAGVAIGSLLFGEKLTTTHWVGIVLAGIGMMLLAD